MMFAHARSRSAVRWAALTGSVVTGALLLTACGGGADAGGAGEDGGDGQTWTLRTNDFNPPNHPFNVDGWDLFADKIEERTDGRVTIEHYPSEGLGAVGDTLSMLQSGEADMASTVVAYHPEDMPISQVTGGVGWDSAVAGAQAMWELCNSEPFVTEMKGLDIVPVVCTSVSSYELLLGQGEIDEIPGAFDGKRIRATGFQQQIVAALGASTTSDPASELYVRMEQGQIDGLTAGWYTLPALSLAEVSSAGTYGLNNWNAGLVIYAMPKSLWDQFPADIQEIIAEVGKETSLTIAEGVDEMDAQAREDNADSMQIYEVSDAERKAVSKIVDGVFDEWVKTAEAAGLTEAAAAADAVRATRDIEVAPVEEWADFAYGD